MCNKITVYDLGLFFLRCIISALCYQYLYRCNADFGYEASWTLFLLMFISVGKRGHCWVPGGWVQIIFNHLEESYEKYVTLFAAILRYQPQLGNERFPIAVQISTNLASQALAFPKYKVSGLQGWILTLHILCSLLHKKMFPKCIH